MIQNAIRTIRTLLPLSGSVTRAQIEQKVDSVLKFEEYRNLDKELLIRHLQELYRIYQDDYRIIEKEDRRRPWLNEKRANIDFENGFWGRYRDYLGDEKNLAPDTIRKLDRLTDKILDSLFDPTEKVHIDKKGLVVGQVQSGKTANYTGLICKAADAGFKLIIILAGIHNNLRSQTQLRLDEGFLGFDTQHTRAFNQNTLHIGVGRLGRHVIAHSLTSSQDNGDFTKPAANALGLNFDTNEPIIAVIKKNSSILWRIHQWLSAQATEDSELGNVIRNKSLLLIDDEADHASINISNDPVRRSKINDLITKILTLFGKNGYVGYTATPFANIFIPLDDANLFPRDYIINIPPPSNYIGPEKIFGFSYIDNNEGTDTTLPIINRIDDYALFVPDRHKKDDQLPSEIPASLKRAIRCFVITCAIRRLRGQVSVHNSMLVHVSRFIRWQRHIADMIESQFNYYRMGIDQNDAAIIREFEDTFKTDAGDYKSYITVSDQILNSELASIDSQIQKHTWEDVLSHLNDAASRIEVKAIHGGSGEALEYYEHRNGLSVIAVGGNKLSRGLTLEGLSISYYLRASRMYDTLMQMGRWFGYREGYVDLCRLFTSRELNEWFCHITHASEELREEFEYMSDVAGATPEQYALKVRTHPGVLQISATNKMRSAVTVQISLSGRLVESYQLKKDIQVINQNLAITQNFVAGLPDTFVPAKIPDSSSQGKKGYLWFDVPAKNIIKFFQGMQSVENLLSYQPPNLIRFITKQLPNGELTEWRVILMSKGTASSYTDFQIAGSFVKIGQWKRTQDENSDDNIYHIRKSHIISKEDECLDLTPQEYEEAMGLTRIHRKRLKKKKEFDYPNGEIVRNKIRNPQNPLLLLYLLDPQESETGVPDGTNPFVGYAISFPKSNFNSLVSYSVHEQLLDRFNVDDDFEDDDEN